MADKTATHSPRHSFADDKVAGFSFALASGRVCLSIGQHEHETTVWLTPEGARALANTLYVSAEFAENALPTGLGESAVTDAAVRSPINEAPRDPSIPLRVRGVFRDADEPRSLGIALTDRPTDDDIRSLHDFVREWRP